MLLVPSFCWGTGRNFLPKLFIWRLELLCRPLGFQAAMEFPGALLQLPAAQPVLEVRKLAQQEVEFFAGREIRTQIALVHPPVQGAAANGAVLMAPAVLATRTLRVGPEPCQALAQFWEAEHFFAGETMKPPVGPEAAQVFLEPGHRVQKGGIAKLAIVKQTAKTCSAHGCFSLRLLSRGLPPAPGAAKVLLVMRTED